MEALYSFKRHIYLIITLVVVLTAFGCGQGKQVSSEGEEDPYGRGTEDPPCCDPGATPAPPPGAPIPTPAPLTTGATATLNIVGSTPEERAENLKTFWADPHQGPTSPVQINVKLAPNGSVYLGKIKIRFHESKNSQLYLREATLSNGTSTSSGNNVHIFTTDTNGAATYRIFGEDKYGAIILLLRGPTSNMTGELYYRNFNGGNAPNPLFDTYCDSFGRCWPPNPKAFCWTGIPQSGGPFDCRNMSIPPSTTSSTAFTLLGSISSINGNVGLGL